MSASISVKGSVAAMAGVMTVLTAMPAPGGGPDFDLGQNLTAMSDQEDWVYQMFWNWQKDPDGPKVRETENVGFEITAHKFDMVRFTNSAETRDGDFQVLAGNIDDPFQWFRDPVGESWTLEPDTEYKITLHFDADASPEGKGLPPGRLNLWIDDDLVLPNFIGPGFYACSEDFRAIFEGRCDPGPHAAEKVSISGDTYGPITLGLLDPNSPAGVAPLPLLDDASPGLNIPLVPAGRSIDDAAVDWGAVNRVFGTWDTSTGRLISPPPPDGAGLRLQTTLKGAGERLAVFEVEDEDGNLRRFRGDVNGDRNLNNLDITPFILALTIGGDIRDPSQQDQFLAQVAPEDQATANIRSADMQRDNRVDNLDITLFIEGLALVAGQAGGAAVPEPVTLTLLAAGLAATLRRRRRVSRRVSSSEAQTHRSGQ